MIYRLAIVDYVPRDRTRHFPSNCPSFHRRARSYHTIELGFDPFKALIVRPSFPLEQFRYGCVSTRRITWRTQRSEHGDGIVFMGWLCLIEKLCMYVHTYGDAAFTPHIHRAYISPRVGEFMNGRPLSLFLSFSRWRSVV